MNQNELIETVKNMIAAPSCCPELKNAGETWLKALGTPKEKAAAAALLQEVREDVADIDHVIEFFGSDLGKQIFGEAKAAELLEHSKTRKAAGEKWCDCPACTACLKILDNAGLLA